MVLTIAIVVFNAGADAVCDNVRVLNDVLLEVGEITGGLQNTLGSLKRGDFISSGK